MATLQRTYLRQAAYRLLSEDPELAASFGGSIFANRVDPYVNETPALGLYILKDTPLPESNNPPRGERQAQLVIQVLASGATVPDTFIDNTQARIEQILTYEALAQALEAQGGFDGLVELHNPEFELAMAEDDGQDTACGFIAFQADYIQPPLAPKSQINNFEQLATDMPANQGRVQGFIKLDGPWPDMEKN